MLAAANRCPDIPGQIDVRSQLDRLATEVISFIYQLRKAEQVSGIGQSKLLFAPVIPACVRFDFLADSVTKIIVVKDSYFSWLFGVVCYRLVCGDRFCQHYAVIVIAVKRLHIAIRKRILDRYAAIAGHICQGQRVDFGIYFQAWHTLIIGTPKSAFVAHFTAQLIGDTSAGKLFLRPCAGVIGSAFLIKGRSLRQIEAVGHRAAAGNGRCIFAVCIVVIASVHRAAVLPHQTAGAAGHIQYCTVPDFSSPTSRPVPPLIVTYWMAVLLLPLFTTPNRFPVKPEIV